MTLSITLIIKNEATNLPEFFKSFAGLYDEIVIVDTGSTDESKTLTQQHGARVFDFEWIDDFAAARNFANAQATSDFILMLDADDRITENNKISLKTAIKTASPEIKGFLIPYEIRIPNRPLKSSVFPKIWRKNLNLQYKLRIHEYLEITPDLIKDFKRLDSPIYTTGDFRANYNRNIAILEKGITEDPQNTRYLYFLAHDSQYSGQLEKAIYWYKKYTSLPALNPDEKNRALMNLSLCLIKKLKIPEAKQTLQSAIDENPKFIEPYFILSDLLKNEKNWTESLQFLEKAQHLPPPKTHMFVNQSLYKDMAQAKMKAIHELMNKSA